MANEKNNINELVSDDEDPTAELEAVTFRQDHQSRELLRESDDNTFDYEQHAAEDAKTIGKLQYDIEQLRAKWTGLETEIKAREELTDSLNAEMAGLRDSLARKEKLLKARDHKIKTLKSEIRDREERHRDIASSLQAEIDATNKVAREIPAPPDERPSNIDLPADANRLARTEDYADLLRRKLQDIMAQQDETEKERKRLDTANTAAIEQYRKLQHELAEARADNEALDEQLVSIGDKHAEEIRTVRFELGEAQETVAQTEIISTQLASDLLDNRGFKEELERMLSDNDEQSRIRIDKLEHDLAKMTRKAQDFEEKLDARSEAINVLLTELARKNVQQESIDEIGDVISDIDVRISERFDDPDDAPAKPSRSQDRVARLLVGKIGDKLLRFPLFKDRLTIGRTADNDIQLNAVFISRRHAVVTTDGEKTRVIDWGSKNGVFVNSTRVTEHFLKNGDIVTIGNAHFRYDERPKRDN